MTIRYIVFGTDDPSYVAIKADDNTFTGDNTFSGATTFSGDVIIDSDTKGLKLGADQDMTLYSDGAGALKLTAATNTDIAITANGTTKTGVLTWMEDEDYWQFADDINLGGATNYVQIADDTGQISWGGTYKKKLAMRPAFVAGRVSGVGSIPTAVVVGAYAGYSMPIWSTPANQYEELYWRLSVPGRWDGTTDIEYKLYVCLAAAETENDDFAFELVWANTNGTTGAISTSVVDIADVTQNIGAGHTAQYSVFILTFTIDVSEGPGGAVAAGDVLAGRLRRVASGGTEIDNEVIVLDHVLNFTVDKVFKVA